MGDCECHGDVYCSDCGATLAAAEATIADLRAEVETLKMLLPVVGSITFPPGCVKYAAAKVLFEQLEGIEVE